MMAAAATETRVAPGAITESSVVTAAATVVAIDQTTRQVTLRMADGQLSTIKVDPAVRNLAQVRKGDEVVATYYESVAVQVKKPGEAEPGVTASADAARAQPGELPAGAVAQTTTVVATVTKIDRKHQSVTLRRADGTIKTVDVRNPAHLEKLKVGDLVELSLTEALAIQVEKAPKRSW
jgi:DNA helicase TIP49 (TBP-interacting protein)